MCLANAPLFETAVQVNLAILIDAPKWTGYGKIIPARTNAQSWLS
jgi:hypothetical protein